MESDIDAQRNQRRTRWRSGGKTCVRDCACLTGGFRRTTGLWGTVLGQTGWRLGCLCGRSALVSNTCQIVRWVDEPGHNYWLVNVLTLIPRTQWTCEKSSVYSGTYASADGIRVLAESIPHIFRLEGYEGKTFVSDELAKLSVASKLKGAAFVHPLIHWAESVFMPRRFGRDGTGFVHLSPESRFRGMH
jgi:hypothetical protein